ncbi:ribosome silencing factor [bacterium]|nr:ribosome silencing factor [bacterium]
MTSRQLAQWCAWLADNRKAEQIVILDVSKLSSVTDFFVIASGTSEPHLRAIRDEITDTLRQDFDVRPGAVDVSTETAWVALDYFDVIVHIMKPEVRELYDLEGLWRDAPRVKQRKPATPKAKETAKRVSSEQD